MLGVGRTLRYSENDFLKTSIFLNIYAVLAILDTRLPDEEYTSALNTLCHELCHVNDITIKEKIYPKEFLFGKSLPTVRDKINFVADSIWEEYYACRVANACFNIPYSSWLVPHLVNITESREREIKNKIWLYRIRQISLDDLFDEVTLAASSILNCAGRVLGSLDGTFSIETEEKIDAQIEGLMIEPIWPDLKTSLNQLYERYPIKRSW
jgi:hypothetical protein